MLDSWVCFCHVPTRMESAGFPQQLRDDLKAKKIVVVGGRHICDARSLRAPILLQRQPPIAHIHRHALPAERALVCLLRRLVWDSWTCLGSAE